MKCNTPIVAAQELFGDANEVWYGMLTIEVDTSEGEFVFTSEDDGFVVHRADIGSFDSIEALASEIDKQNNQILQAL